mmetsp:Transcript_14947/g.53824  ORF Transcript_14947/g.53824 Transcript_14947/m.53824 type:complete len:253 (+) Transcript_14947:2437-3195(+)
MVALYATASLSPKNFPGARKYATSPGRSFGRRSVRYRYPLAPSHSRPPSPPPSASPSASRLGFGLYLRCSPARQNCASGGVCVRHCITAFMKHVLPKFASPAPIFRASGHSILMFAAGYSASFTATPFGSVASSRGVAREEEDGIEPPRASASSPRAPFRTIIFFIALSDISGGSERRARTKPSFRRFGSTSRSSGANGAAGFFVFKPFIARDVEERARRTRRAPTLRHTTARINHRPIAATRVPPRARRRA